MHDEHQGFFDALAAEWDLMFTSEDLERLSRIVDRLGLKRGMEVLDLGCGTGILFDMLRRKVTATGSVTGVDFSYQMAQRAHRNFPFNNVNVVDADAINLPFADSSFDMAVAFSAFPHFSDQQKAIDEAHRVLRDWARFYIIHLTSSREISRIHHKIGGAVEHDGIPAEKQLRTMLNTSKFTDISIEDHHGLYLAIAQNRR
ncbi:MAG: methyltransferase domain-containing protein [Candidatus Zixiibacteriota bacterium]|nr:MAG: methyltransferase domain-containing protein [candidate division Zixibacteria bacterium]